MTMSWLAEKKATTMAATAVHQALTDGSVNPMATIGSRQA